MKQTDLSNLSSKDWISLFLHVSIAEDVEEIRKKLDPFIHNPLVSISFIHNYIRTRKYKLLEELFKEILSEEISATHWLVYLKYLKNQKKEIKTIVEAYEFAVSKNVSNECGLIWESYICFVKESEMFSSYEDGQREEYLKILYRKVLSIPNTRLDVFWKEYNELEDGSEINSVLNRNKEISTRIDFLSIDRTTPPSVDCSLNAKRIGAGTDLIVYEESIYLRDKNEKNLKNVINAYRSVLYVFVYWKELYVRLASFLVKEGFSDIAEKFLLCGAKIMPGCEEISLVLAHLLERNGKEKEAVLRMGKCKGSMMQVEFLALVRRVSGLEEAFSVFNKNKENYSHDEYFYISSLLENKKAGDGYKTFEEGLNRFKNNSLYMCNVIDFYCSKGDYTHAMLFFETILTVSEKGDVEKAWERILYYERMFFGNTNSVSLLEKRKESFFDGRKYIETKTDDEKKTNEKVYEQESSLFSKEILDELVPSEKRIPSLIAETIVQMPLFYELDPIKNIDFLIECLFRVPTDS